jgi:hypothetical protein
MGGWPTLSLQILLPRAHRPCLSVLWRDKDGVLFGIIAETAPPLAQKPESPKPPSSQAALVHVGATSKDIPGGFQGFLSLAGRGAGENARPPPEPAISA